MAHTPFRMCVACRKRRPRHELVRMAAGPDGVGLDVQRRLPGRGAYVCPDPTCIGAAKRRGARVVRHALRTGDEYEVVTVLSRIDDQDVAPKERGR
ncbi:MAG: YlxR family protein [Actinomycetota bacterium]|nr:YlxR family protein [Actinomycetota bacterium]